MAVLALRYIGLGEGDAYWSPWIIFIVSHCLGISECKVIFRRHFCIIWQEKLLICAFFTKCQSLHLSYSQICLYRAPVAPEKSVRYIEMVVSREVSFVKFACFGAILWPSSLKNYCETLNLGNSWNSWWLTK